MTCLKETLAACSFTDLWPWPMTSYSWCNMNQSACLTLSENHWIVIHPSNLFLHPSLHPSHPSIPSILSSIPPSLPPSIQCIPPSLPPSIPPSIQCIQSIHPSIHPSIRGRMLVYLQSDTSSEMRGWKTSSSPPPFAFRPREHSKFFIRRGNHSPIFHTLPICKCHRGVGMCVCVC